MVRLRFLHCLDYPLTNSWKAFDATARVEEICQVVRMAASSESGVVQMANERAEAFADGSDERNEANAFCAWAAETKAAVTHAAIARQSDAEINFEAQIRRAKAFGGLHADGSASGSVCKRSGEKLKCQSEKVIG